MNHLFEIAASLARLFYIVAAVSGKDLPTTAAGLRSFAGRRTIMQAISVDMDRFYSYLLEQKSILFPSAEATRMR